MLFKNFQPCPYLQELVKVYHLRHFSFNPSIKRPPKAFTPRPEQYIAFYPRGYEITHLTRDGDTIIKPKSVITGQYTQLINRHTSDEFMIIQVCFMPGALHRLTRIPFDELRDASVDLENLYSGETKEVNEKLQEAQEYSDMIGIVYAFLVNLFKQKVRISERPIDIVMKLLSQNNACKRIDWLASQSCLSVRQFERLSNEYLGVGPKIFARIARFNNSYIMRLKHPEFSWLRIAMECGYEDYQHLVRDYKEFSSFTPNKIIEVEYGAPDRVLGLRPRKS